MKEITLGITGTCSNNRGYSGAVPTLTDLKTNSRSKVGSLLVLLIFGLAMLMPSGINAQNPPPLPDEKSCVAQDLLIVDARLDIDACFQCKIGDPAVPFNLILEIDNKTGSFRPTFAFWATLEVTEPGANPGDPDIVTTSLISGCDDTTGLPDKTSTELTFQEISYKCGSTLKLTDIFIAYTDASKPQDNKGNYDPNHKNSCPEITTKLTSKGKLDIAPKCGTQDEIVIDTPLDVTIDDEVICEGQSVTLTANATGGGGEYSYSWTPGGETSSSIEVFPGVDTDYTVTVTAQSIFDPNEICEAEFTAKVTVNDNPAGLVLTGSSICTAVSGTGGITSSTSVSGVSYQLYDSSDAIVQAAKPGTGSGLTWSNVAAGTGYYAIATGAAPTSCTSQSNAVDVIEVPNPAALVLTGSSICTSVTGTGGITSSTSVSGVSYQLYDSSDAIVQAAKPGTGSGLTWSNVAAGTGYYAIATGAAPTSCTSQSNAVDVIEVPNPAALVLTGSSICTSVTGTGGITSSTSVSGVSYQLYDSSDAIVQAAKPGTGSGLTWSNVAAGTGYYAIATGAAPTSCTSQSNAVDVIEVPNPAALVLTGSSICTSVTGTGGITSSTSVSGVSYQLYDSSDAIVQAAKPGTGSGLTWSNVAAGTGYYAIATGAAPTSCTSQSNAVDVIEVPNPAALVLTGSSICTSVTGTGGITSSTSVSGVSYQLYDSSDAIVQAAKPGTGSGLTWSNVTAGTGYYAIATGAAPTSCTSQSNAVDVIEVPNPAALVLTGSSICTSVTGTGGITSSTSVSGVSYQLYDSSDAIVQAAKPGTGSGLTWSNVAAGTGYYAIATGAAPTSCTSQSNAVDVIEVPNPIAGISTLSVCVGENSIFTATPAGQAAYHFFVDANSNGVIDTDEGLQDGVSDTYNAGSLSQGAMISVLVTNSNNCTDVATATAIVEICEVFEGCTLGYWKNHTDRWPINNPESTDDVDCLEYSTCTKYEKVFSDASGTILEGKTLLEVLNLGGGGIINLGRQSVAALLNTCNKEINYEITRAELIFFVNSRLKNDPGNAGAQLDGYNNAGCTLGGSRATTAPNGTCTVDTSKPGKPSKVSNLSGGFIASPVPFKENLTIQYDFEYTSNVTIQVYDLRGQLLRSYKDSRVTKGDKTELDVDFRMKANQVYILRVATDRDVFSKSVISAKR